MNIAVIFHDNDMYSGASRSMLSLMETWKKDNNKIIAIIPSNGTMSKVIREKQITVYEIPHFKTRVNLGRGSLYRFGAKIWGICSYVELKLYTILSLKSIIRREKIEILYANTTASMVGYELKKCTSLPLVWHIREFGIEDQNCEYVFGRNSLLKKLNRANLIVYISKAVKKSYSSQLSGPLQIVAYNDISSSFDCYTKRNWNKNELVLLSVGSVIPGKGHQYVIDAVISLRREGYPIRLKIAGKGQAYETQLRNYITKNNADEYIEMLGQVDDMSELRSRCDIGVVASTMEAFGRVTIEGMLSGMAMIGSNSGGTAELIKDGVTGLLFNPADVDSLKAKIKYLFDNRDAVLRIADEGYTFSKQFIKGNCAETIIREMKSVINE